MNVQLFFNAVAFAAAKCGLWGMLTMTMTAAFNIAMASDRTIDKLPSDQRLFYTPDERKNLSAEIDSVESPEAARVSAIDLPSRAQETAHQRSAETHEEDIRNDGGSKNTGYSKLRFNGFVSANTSYQLLINNLPCHLSRIDPTGSTDRAQLVVCPHLRESRYRLEFHTSTRKLFVHYQGEQSQAAGRGRKTDMAMSRPSELPSQLTIKASWLVRHERIVQTPCPSRLANEAGYVLILMLFVLISGSSVWMLNGLNSLWHGRATMIQTNSDWLAMGYARQALISYAAVYPYLYGPAGAGPGHLPCAADSTTTMSTLMPEPQPFGNGEGPNPPCAHSNLISGKLPRHISFPGHRYMFHAQAGQLFGYSVLRDVVNNPATQPLHPGRMAIKSDASRVVAWLSLSSQPQQSQFQPASSRLLHSNESQQLEWARMPITQQALLEATVPVVAGWFTSVANRLILDQRYCAENIDSDEQSHDAKAVSDTNRRGRAAGASAHEAVLMWLFDELPDSIGCHNVELASMSIEGVPASRHWFVRNEWHHWMEVVHDERCTGKRLSSCQLVFLRSPRDRSETDMSSSQSSNAEKIRLAWRPVS